MPSPEVHSPYGPSQAHAWEKCPQYVKVQAMFPEATSSYAEAGRLAHSIAEYKARTYFHEPVGKRAYNARLKKFKAAPHYDPAMEEATELYLETLKELALSFSTPPFVALETMVSYTDWVPEGFGTSDCVMIGSGRIIVIDYKNGAGVPVEAEDNSQMKLYALGALQTFRPIYGDTLQEATLVIVQPHAGGVKRWDTTVAEVLKWGEEVIGPAALRAREATEPACPGDWCRFCKGKSQCTARAKQMLDAGRQFQQAPAAGSEKIPEDYSGPLLTDEEVGAALAAGAGLVCPPTTIDAGLRKRSSTSATTGRRRPRPRWPPRLTVWKAPSGTSAGLSGALPTRLGPLKKSSTWKKSGAQFPSRVSPRNLAEPRIPCAVRLRRWASAAF